MRLERSPESRRKFVDSQIVNEVAFQIRGLRNKKQLSQPELAGILDTTQNQIYRLENPDKSKPTLSTLKKIAAAFDVGLVVRFVPFGEMIDYLTRTPRLDTGISSSRRRPESFPEELPALKASISATGSPLARNQPTVEYVQKPNSENPLKRFEQGLLELQPPNVTAIDAYKAKKGSIPVALDKGQIGATLMDGTAGGVR